MKESWRKYRHIVKLDPDREISKSSIDKIVASGTDAIMVSGTQNITKEKVLRLLSKLKSYKIPKILEPSHPYCIVEEGFDHIFVPSVLNSLSIDWVVGLHVKWIEKFKIPWEKIVREAYIVLNPDSSVAKVTNAKTKLSINEVVAYATCAEKYFNFPIVYLEWSGSYGEVKTVEAVSKALSSARLFYGGGINSKSKAVEMLKYANTIVVGNVFYENLPEALKTVIK
ncbi:MAG: heptaprenylglyceryl phosphate synthase [Candidatus Thermoplasmatota archaeon]